MNRLIEEMHASKYRGIFHEVGVGMELTASLLRVAGASKTVIGAHCDYSGCGKPPGMRAVSLEYVEFLAHKAREEGNAKTIHYNGVDGNIFGMAISAVDYTDRTSHAWIYISRLSGEQDAYMHVNFAPGAFDREQLGKKLGEIGVAFLYCVLFGCRIHDIREINNKNVYADVIYAPGVGDIERLSMLTDNSPLLYHNGKFHRVVDYLRKYPRIYGGSFDPPHNDHIKSGQDSLFLLSTTHPYKGGLSLDDIYHRIRMLDLYGVPVLIMKDRPMFWQKHELLKQLWNQEYTYVLGSDAWNTMIIAHQYPNHDFMRNHFHDAIFEIIPRVGEAIQTNQISEGLRIKVSDIKAGKMSSTVIRYGDLHGLNNLVAEYIRVNKLYT